MSPGPAAPPHSLLTSNSAQYGVPLTTLFSPSPRLTNFGLRPLASSYNYYDLHQLIEGLPTFGVVLSGMAVLGVAAGWRNRSTWVFVALCLAGAALPLGTSLPAGTCQCTA